MKNINYKMKYLKWVVYSSRGILCDKQLSKIILVSTIRTSNMTEMKLIYFFVKNRCRSQQGHNAFL